MTSGNTPSSSYQRYDAVRAQTVPGLSGRFSYYFNYRNDPVKGIEHLARQFGDAFILHLFGDDFFMLNNPEIIRQVLETNEANYTRHASLDPYTAIFGPGFFEPPGDTWNDLLSLLAPALQPGAFPVLDRFIDDEIENMKTEWLSDRDSRDRINIEIEMQKLLIRIVSRALITPELEINTHPLIEAAEDIFRATNLYTSPKLFPKSRRILHRFSNQDNFPDYVRSSIRYIHGLAEQIGSEYMNIKSERGFALKLLYEPYVHRRLTFAQVVDGIKYTLLTTALPAAQGMTVFLSALDSEPGLRRKLETETGEKGNGTEISPLLRSALLESWRLSPPVWAIHRVAAREEMAARYLVPQNSRLFICPSVLHRSSAYWQKPEQFIAERFILPDFTMPEFAYLPFGYEKHYNPLDISLYVCGRIATKLLKEIRIYFYKAKERRVKTTCVTSSGQTLFTRVEAMQI